MNVNGGGINNNASSNELQINVAFITQTGKKIMMSSPYSTKLKDFLIKYASRMGISGSIIGKDIFFIYNYYVFFINIDIYIIF